MRLLYSAGILAYDAAIRIAAITGHQKARKWVSGRKKLLQRIQHLPPQKKTAWFHCASLGEFEQGRPVIEEFRKRYPDYIIVLTFFSPSGYEIRKNYEQADFVYYLPADTPGNAVRFINQIHPDIAFFVKYEFWFNFLKILQKNQVPVYLLSGIFHKSQHFFAWYGGWFRKQLRAFDKFFVQDETSHKLIESILPGKSLLTGDTRFDRVSCIAQQAKSFPDINAFKNGKTLFLAGSTWPADEDVLLPAIKNAMATHDVKMIIAPHEVGEQRMNVLLDKLPEGAVRYSQTNGDFSNKKILIIDSIGLLSHLYQYGDIAYIGGGFGVGIHNTLEAATFGLPVIFGPNFQKFQEAKELIENEAAFAINSAEELRERFFSLLQNEASKEKAGEKARQYVDKKRGSTQKILANIGLRESHL